MKSKSESRKISVRFSNIPEHTVFSIFDKANKKTEAYREDAPVGDSEFNFDIPDDWSDPSISIAPFGYYIPHDVRYRPVEPEEDCLDIDGSQYYLDITRDETEAELNQKSVETLIHSNNGLTGRQKFYVTLVALQSHFEYLVYGMLVMSGHISKTKFKKLQTHEKRTETAFSADNTEFFADKILICPGKEVEPGNIQDDQLNKMKNILDEIRTLRNGVVHAWSYKDKTREDLAARFNSIGENLHTHQISDDKFFEEAAFILLRLYAQTSSLNNRIMIFKERKAIEEERTSRGYS